ncbi:response regulator [Chitinivibrio alkaliphilus]|nr:response regulator [Chitinivibrio alkaliphilus]
MGKKMIYAVEDDPAIQELLTYNIVQANYDCEVFDSAEKMLTRVSSVPPTLIILDILLPGMDGIEACRNLKMNEETADIPVVMLTAKGDEVDVVTGLELGADDYIVKPFSPRILMARIKSVLRRRVNEKRLRSEPMDIHSVHIHPGRHEVVVSGKSVDLTASEFSALYMLAKRPGWVFSRYQIVEEIHGPNYPVTDRSVDVMIAGLRKKLGDKGALIETVRGIGYRMKEEAYEEV